EGRRRRPLGGRRRAVPRPARRGPRPGGDRRCGPAARAVPGRPDVPRGGGRALRDPGGLSRLGALLRRRPLPGGRPARRTVDSDSVARMTLDRRTLLALSAGSLLSLRFAPKPAPTPEVKTGGVRLIPIDGGKYKVWTKKLGAGKIKVLTLHGGPGFTH